MVICSLDALEKSSKKKETRIKKEIAEVLQQPSYRKKRLANFKIRVMKFLALTLYLLARITLTLISSSAIIGCFQKLNFQGFNLVIWNFELPSEFLYALVSYSKNSLFYVKKYSVLLKIRDSLLCVTNRCIKVTGKLIWPSVSRFKFCSHYKSTVKQIYI